MTMMTLMMSFPYTQIIKIGLFLTELFKTLRSDTFETLCRRAVLHGIRQLISL